MKEKSIHVLMVEDSEDDALLVIRTLKKNGFNPVYDRVETTAAMKKTLEEKQWDIILCDYQMPAFNAPAAIALLKKIHIDIPIIIVSGTIGEETAVECMRLGANDYIMKSNLSRLVPAITRELNEAKIRRKKKHAEENLRRERQRFSTLAEQSSDIIALISPEGTILYENEAVERILGFKPDDRIGKGMLENIHPDDLTSVMDTYNELFIDRNFSIKPKKEVRIRHKNGNWLTFEFVGNSLVNNNVIEAVIVNLRDITKRKQAEDSLRASKELFTKLVNAIPDIIVHTDLKGKILFVNDYTLQVSGYTREEIKNQNILNFISPEDQAQAIQNTALMLNEKLGPKEFNFLIKDGRKVPFEVNGDVLRDQDGNPLGFVNVCRDISERKRTERLLRENDERLRGITQNFPGVIFQFYIKNNGETGVSYVSEPMEKFRKTVLNKTSVNQDNLFQLFFSCIHDDDKDRFLTSVKMAVETITNWNFEGRAFINSGEMVWFQGLSVPTRLEDQTVFNGILLDITGRKSAEEKFHKIFMTTPDCIGISRLNDGMIIDINKGFEETVGWKREIAIGTRSAGPPLNFWADPSEREFMVKELNAGRDVIHHELKFRRNDGTVRDGIYSARPININDEDCVIFIFQDVTEHKLAEEKFRKVFMTTPDCIVISRLRDGLVLDVNKGFEDIVGWKRDVAIGLKSAESPLNFWVDHSEREYMKTELEAGRDILNRQFEFRRKEGSIRTGIYSARSFNIEGETSVIFILQDITEQKQMEKQLAESDRMKLMSRIASGVAHEVRNPLHAIQAISEAMAIDLDEKSEYKDYLMHIKDQVARLSHLMNDLLDLGKPIQPSQFSPASLTEIVTTSLGYWREAHTELTRQVRVINKLQREDRVMIDTNKIQQVIINLLENAVQHSPQDEEISLEIDKDSERYLMIKIIDRGIGIKPQDMPRIFEPFYTTHRSGTGLGLSICKHIIESHAGSIEIVNNRGVSGCTARFKLPVLNKELQ